MQSRHFAIIYRIRRRYLYLLTIDLYRRYAHAAMLFIALFGLMLRDRPDIITWPILHFSLHPANVKTTVGALLTWHILVWCWTLSHRPGIRGGSFPIYSRSLPISRHLQLHVNLAILTTSLLVFWAIMLFAALQTIASPHPAGIDGRFWFYFAVLGLSTLHSARIAVDGGSRRSWAALILALSSLAAIPATAGSAFGAAALTGICALLTKQLMTPATACASKSSQPKPVARTMRRFPYLMLLKIQISILAQSWHVLLARIGLVVAVQCAACLLIGLPDKAGDRHVFLQLACAATIGIMAGLYFTLRSARSRLEPWLGTIASGRSRWHCAEHLIVVGAATSLLAVATLYLTLTSTLAFSQLACVCLYYLLWLPLLGLDRITRHHHAVIIKAAMLVAALIIGLNNL